MEPKVYEYLWRNKFLTLDAKSLDDMIETLRAAVDTLEAMKQAGVTLDPEGGTEDDYARLITTDPKVAEKFEFDLQDLDEDMEAEPNEDDTAT